MDGFRSRFISPQLLTVILLVNCAICCSGVSAELAPDGANNNAAALADDTGKLPLLFVVVFGGLKEEGEEEEDEDEEPREE